jgi:hypothetical protein
MNPQPGEYPDLGPHMKITSSILLFFLTLTALGQTPENYQTPPGITVGKHKWQRTGAAPGIDSSFKAESDSPSGGTLSDSDGASSDAAAMQRGGPSFTYSVEIKNDGDKSIKAVLWDYLIADSRNHAELGRHQFASFEGIGRNTVKTLTVRSRTSPTQVVSVQGPQTPDQSAKDERVVFRCVLYDDGSVWIQPGTPEGTCEALRQRARK